MTGVRRDRFLAEAVNRDYGFFIRAEAPIVDASTRFQKIEVFDTPMFGRVLRLDNVFQTSERDEFFYHENMCHVGAIAQPAPRRALVIGGGDGGAVEELLKHNTMQRVVLAELDEGVVEAAKQHLQAIHRGAFSDPRLEVRIGDGKAFIESGAERFDQIVIDLTDASGPSLALYTREFYELCRARLAPGGALCQWFPIHAMSSADFRMLAAAFVEAFPESSLWFVEETAALVGTTGPQGIPVKRSADRLSAPGPREDLAAGRLDDLAQWWSFRVCGGEALREWTRGVRGMTDERPDIEFRPVPSGTLTTYLNDNLATFLELQDADAERTAPDLRGLDPRDAAAFRDRLAAASEATATYMAGRAHEDVIAALQG